MNDACIIQLSYSDGKYYPHMSLSFSRHTQYAKKHNWDLLAYCSDVSDECNIFNKKMVLIEQFIDKYKYIAWIDSDSVIVDDSVDLRDVFNDKPYSICAVEYPDPVFHLNAGVFYIKCDDNGKRAFKDWCSRPFLPPWGEQSTLNQMANEAQYKSIIGPTEQKFNDWFGQSGNSVVVGCHGYNTAEFKYEQMMNHILRGMHVNNRT